MAACLHSSISNSGSRALFSAEKHRRISACVVIGSSSSSSSRKLGNRTILRSSSCAYYSSSVRGRKIIKHVFGSSKYRAFCERWAMFATPVQYYGRFSGKSVIEKCRKRSDSNACASELEQMRRMPPLLRKVAWAAMAALLSWRCRAARAAEVLAVLATRSRSVWSLFWPKVLQVLSVFRDQGLIIAILLSLSAFFSMAETSITTLWPWKVQELAEKEPENGVFRLLRQDVTRFLTTILIGTTVVNIGATALVTEAATTLFGEAGISAATGVMTVVVLLLTEITPKSIAVHNATEVARLVVRPVAWLSVVLYPVGRIVTALSVGMLKLLGLKNRSEHLVTEDELKLMLRGAELSGAIEEEEQDMIENVLDFKETHVREVMTPLVDVVAIDCKATLIEFRNLWETHQYSRVPVYESRIDNIVGIAYAMDMLDYVDQAEFLEKLTVGGIAHKPAYFVPDSMSVWNLLREFRIRKVHMAIVLNEYGGTVGIVTLEDVVEEIVGEIFDESDSKEEIRKKTGYVIERSAGVYDVDANTSIEDLAEALNVKLEEGSYETVSGYVCEAFGYIPRTGESISIVLPKELDEGSNEFGEEESDRQEEKRAKFQKYKLEIISGNARKVGSVRFEEIRGDTAKKDAVTHVSPQIIRQSWAHGMETGIARENSTSLAPILVSKKKDTKDAPTSFQDPYVANDSTEGNIVEVSESDLSVIATENRSIHVKEAEIHSSQQCDIDVTSTASVRSLNEKELEKGTNKKRKKRRKQTAEVHFVESQESVNVRHTESK